ncbi:protein INVOLVED IN DE NOVO 2-like [Miscanthus floridulus]|uniref:protein INVOLVED IN DE NOVO 2-like n=1 Tax=Miscanthus floridulus TaxID=154761 RepID=UPI0034579D33
MGTREQYAVAMDISVFLRSALDISVFLMSAMDYSSDESSELSETDIDDYAEKLYVDLKSGKFVARLGSDRFRCPFCPGKKKQDYRYNELLQHAVGVGASIRAAKVKANHQALEKLLKEDHADAAATLPPRQAIALSNPPKPVQDLEVFVWPWIGFKNALAFHNYFKSQRLGKLEWKETKQHVKYVFGWLAKEEDYKSGDPVGRFLSANGDLKTVSELEQEMSSKTDNLIANLTQQITAKSKYLQELECKCNQMNLSL